MDRESDHLTDIVRDTIAQHEKRREEQLQELMLRQQELSSAKIPLETEAAKKVAVERDVRNEIDEKFALVNERLIAVERENCLLSLQVDVLCSALRMSDPSSKVIDLIRCTRERHSVATETICDECLEKQPCIPCRFCGRENYCSSECQLRRFSKHRSICEAVSRCGAGQSLSTSENGKDM